MAQLPSTIWAPKGEPGDQGPPGDEGPEGQQGPPGPVGEAVDQFLRTVLPDSTSPVYGAGFIGFESGLEYPEKTVGDALNKLPQSQAVVSTINALVAEHNEKGDAHPALTAFITTEADRAVAAADLASQIAGIFVSTAEGLTGTAEGKYFYVPSAASTEVLILYRKVSSAAVDTGKRTPAAALVIDMSNGEFPKLGLRMVLLPPESGYAWAVVDSVGRAAILVSLDGTVTIPKLAMELANGSITKNKIDPELASFFPIALSPDSGYVWALVDSTGRWALAVTTAGKVVGNFDINIPDPEGFKYLQPSINLLLPGDSLTADGTWPIRLATLISPRIITRLATGGQTSVQGAARTGGEHTLVTLQGNYIPASGSVPITSITVRMLSTPAFNGGTFTAKGWLRGVYGTMTCIANAGGDLLDEYSFARDAAGTSLFCPANMPFVPDIAGDGFNSMIIWLGRNNLSEPDVVKSNIDSIVKVQKTVERRVLILTPPLGGTLTPGQSTTEGIGSAIYNNCVSVEDYLMKKYGDVVINIRELMQQYGNGSADDLDDIAKGVVPRSLRSDGVHFNLTGNDRVADEVAYEINRRGW